MYEFLSTMYPILIAIAVTIILAYAVIAEEFKVLMDATYEYPVKCVKIGAHIIILLTCLI